VKFGLRCLSICVVLIDVSQRLDIYNAASFSAVDRAFAKGL